MKKAVLHYVYVCVFLLIGSLVMAQAPTLSNVDLSASSPGNTTDDDLTFSYTPSASVVEVASSWYKNGAPEATVYYPFEGGSATYLEDFSGYSNHATFTANPSEQPTWVATGGYNGAGAFSFDGDDYLVAGDVLPINQPYTKTAWINIATTASGFRNIISSEINDLNNHHFKVNPNGRLNAGHSFGDPIVYDPDSMNHDQWYFVAVTFDYASGEMILYRDGVEVDREIVPESLRSVDDPATQIGAKDGGFRWQGMLDECRIYDRVLSPEQIASMYANGNNFLVPQETSGGDLWYVVATPFTASEKGSKYISNFINITGPQISGLSISASSANNLTIDDLTASFTPNSVAVETATAWYRNSTPVSLLYLPFEGGALNSQLDFSGNDNHVTKSIRLDSIPAWNATGGYNGSGAFVFDGNDYLLASNLIPINSDYSKTAWVNRSSDAFNNIMSGTNNNDNYPRFKVNPDGTLNAGHSAGETAVSDPAAMNLDQWYFVAVTFDYETGEMVLYKNGSEVDRGTVSAPLRTLADGSVLVGAMDFGFGWHGLIDEPMVFDHVLTPEQISSMYSNGNEVVVAEETAGLDQWHADVTPFSVYEVGSTSTSNSITIHSMVVTDVTGETIQEGASFSTFDLDDYVVDYDYSDAELTWDYSGNSELGVSIDPVTHVASITIPDIDWFGSEAITFTVTNPNTEEGSTEATFTVNNVNDAPVLVDIGGQETDEDTNLTGRVVNFSDPDGIDTHTITVVSSNPNVSVQNLSGDTDGSTYNLVPAANWNGSAQITVTVTDNGSPAMFDSETYTLVVHPVNDPPVIAGIGDQDTDEDVTLTGLTVTFSDLESFDTHTITVESDEANVTVANLSGDISGSTYDLVPAENWNGSAQITVTVTDDGTGTLSDVEVYTLNVQPINDAPEISNIGDQFTFEDNSLLGLSVDFIDPDAGDTHTIQVSSLEANVTVQNLSGNTSGSTYDLVPAPNWIGIAQITVTVTEVGAGGLSDSEIYALEVGAINDAPVLTKIGDQSVDEDNSVTGLSVVFTDADPTDEHTITVVSSEAGVSIANLIGNTSGSTYDLVPDADWNGNAQITVTVTDNGTGSLSDFETYTFTVNPVNDAPVLIELSNNAIDEGVAVGTIVGMLSSTDADANDLFTYSFVYDGGEEEVDNQFFKIDGDELKVASEMDYELKNSFSLLLETDDGNGGTLIQQIPVIVNNIVETGIGDEQEGLSFTVYPVPAVDRLTVEVENPENAELLLEIYSSSGVLVHSEYTVHGNTIDVSDFSKGMYILRMHGEGIFKTQKIIVGD